MIFGKKKRKEKSPREEKKQSPPGKNKNLASRIASLFKKDGETEAFYEDLEDLLIESDMGGTVTMEISSDLRSRVKKNKISDQEGIIRELRTLVAESVKEDFFEPEEGKLNLFLILGVNGVGKTTSIAKMARHYKNRGVKDIVLAAADTFRAGAIDQLKIQGERTGCRVVAQQPGSDPGAVIFDTISSAKSRGEKLILADTAGRMHNKKNLVLELEKIDKVIKNNLGDGVYKKILVIDATTGQNGMQQAEIFHEAVGVDGIVMTKYDSTARGGLLVSICRRLGIPFLFLGRGEGLDDLTPFDKEVYLSELISLEGE
ncbi:MAG: signal recognition particle-docking protein FtsY [Spirochaetales bacterium]|nr:signal recognition particle-docking protein FtsY [Spirochaetales bacterium]